MKRDGLEFENRIYSLLLFHVHLCKAHLVAKTRGKDKETEFKNVPHKTEIYTSLAKACTSVFCSCSQ